MKRFIPFAAVLLLVLAVPAFAVEKRSIVDEVIRMSQADVSDETIIAFVANERDRYTISADDVIALSDAHVSKEVIKAVIDDAADREDVRRRESRVYVQPALIGWWGPWYDPYWYDPWWYQPRLSVRFAFGSRYYPRFPHRLPRHR